MRVILASGSPRRVELLKEIFDDFEVITSKVDEREIESEIEAKLNGENAITIAERMVIELSKAKAMAVYDSLDRPNDSLIIGADTTVALSDEILGKPLDRDDAVRMLRKESLEDQKVLTGVCLLRNGKVHSFVETSSVEFYGLDDEQERKIQEYCNTDEPYDKAGAYGIQALGDALVKAYKGDFNNIMGLPVSRLKSELELILR